MCKVQNRMKNQFSDSYNFYFFNCFYPNNRQKEILQKWINLHEICAMSWNEWKINFLIFLQIMVDFVHKIHQKIYLKNKTINWNHFFWWRVRPLAPPPGLRRWTPHSFGLRTLVRTGLRSTAFLKKLSWNCLYRMLNFFWYGQKKL